MADKQRKRNPIYTSEQFTKPFRDILKEEILPGESFEKMLKRKLKL